MNANDQSFVQAMLTTWNAHDVDGAMALMSDDCAWEIARGPEPHGTLFSGQEAVRAAIENLFQSIPDIHYEPLHSYSGQNHIVMELLVTGTLADGTSAKFHACDVLIMNGDKVAIKRSYRKVAG